VLVLVRSAGAEVGAEAGVEVEVMLQVVVEAEVESEVEAAVGAPEPEVEPVYFFQYNILCDARYLQLMRFPTLQPHRLELLHKLDTVHLNYKLNCQQ